MTNRCRRSISRFEHRRGGLGASRASFRPRWLFFLLALVSGYALSQASPAAAGCFYLNGSCTKGSMAANSPTPWTGTYYSTWGQMNVAGTTGVDLRFQIRPYAGASGYSFPANNALYLFWDYQVGNWQHRCFHAGPASPRSLSCQFFVP